MEGLHIALVDDDEDDIHLITECFEELTPASINSYRTVRQFLKALETGEYPGLLVVDLNLPETGGIDLVQYIRSNKSFDKVTVIVFTTGGTPLEKKICESLNVPKYRKPNKIIEWKEMVLTMISHRQTHQLNSDK